MHQPEQHEVHAQQAEPAATQRQAQAVRRRVGELGGSMASSTTTPSTRMNLRNAHSPMTSQSCHAAATKAQTARCEHRVDGVERDAPVEPLPRTCKSRSPRVRTFRFAAPGCRSPFATPSGRSAGC